MQELYCDISLSVIDSFEFLWLPDALKAGSSTQRLPQLGTVDVKSISVDNRDLLDGPKKHGGRVVGMGQVGRCRRLTVPLLIVGDERVAALAGRLVGVVAEAQLWTWK